jgi:hypothetical protein
VAFLRSSEQVNADLKMNEICYHFDWRDHWIDVADAEKAAKQIMHQSAGRMMSIQTYFNDLSMYRWLKSTKGCVRVDLARVLVYHSDSFVFGLQSVYRVTYNNNESRHIAAEKHVYASGFYAHQRGTVSTLDLEDDEFIMDVRTRQGEVVDQVTFVTNLRKVSFGGNGGMEQPTNQEHFANGVMSRVVAFTGTKAGALERLGFFLEPVNWEAIRAVVLTRKLLEESRAHENETEMTTWTREQAVIHALLTQANDDIFLKVAGNLVFSARDQRVIG